MERPVIHVEKLGKRFHLRGGARSGLLKEAMADAARGLSAKLRGQPAPARADTTFWALRDVSFDVQRGEVVGILGHNGSGKSVLLKTLSRISRPTEGFARIEGRVGSLLEIGTGFHPELSGRENVFLNGTILGMARDEIEEKFAEIVDFSGVGHFIDTPTKHYSSGMSLRLAFAVSAFLDADVIFLDEVWAAGDADFQKKSLRKMEQLIGAGRTVLLVSHSLGNIADLCDRAILLDHGRLIADGDTKAVIAHYGELNAAIDRPGAVPLATLRPSAPPVPRGVRTWKIARSAPGNDVVRLRSLAVLDPSGLPVREAPRGAPLELRVVLEVYDAGQSLVAAISLAHEKGAADLLLSNVRDGFDDGSRPPSELAGPGVYEARFPLATTSLENGTYKLSLFAGSPRKFFKAPHVREENVLELEIGPDDRHVPSPPPRAPAPHAPVTWRRLDESERRRLLEPDPPNRESSSPRTRAPAAGGRSTREHADE